MEVRVVSVRASVLRVVCACSLLIALLVAGCARNDVTYVDGGASYSTASLTSVFDQADASRLRSTPVSQASALRHKALTRLRAKGNGAAQAADLITGVFPVDTAGVPIYVERASVDGTQAVVLVEAIGPKGGTLSTKRVWALGADGSVIFSGTR
jgi:hypothetical protein